MTAPSSLAVLAALAAELQRDPDEVVTARAVVSGVRELVLEAERVSLSVRTARRGSLALPAQVTLAGSDGVAEEVDALQHALGEGPCHLLAGVGTWLRSEAVETDPRWPAWGPVAAERGVRSLLAVAVTDGETVLGTLTLSSSARGGFVDRRAVDLGLAYALHAATALSSARRATTLQAAVSSRHVIGMAQGIVMVRYGIDQQQSFDLLRRLSSTSNVKLRHVAARIVETRTVPFEVPRGQVTD